MECARMSRRVGWAALVVALVLTGIVGYERLRGSAHQAHEMSITGKK